MQLIPTESVRGWSSFAATRARFPSSISTICPHCNERALFTLQNQNDDPVRKTITAYSTCPGCKEIISVYIIRQHTKASNDIDNPSDIYMYPTVRNHFTIPRFSIDVPEPLQRSFNSTAEALNSHNYAATAVCARRTLEGIFKYLVPEDRRKAPLAKLIEYTKNSVDLSEPLASLSHAIRDGGNLGAHFDMEKEPTAEIARNMVELLEYLISYLYVLPKKISALEKSLERAEGE